MTAAQIGWMINWEEDGGKLFKQNDQKRFLSGQCVQGADLANGSNRAESSS